MSSLLKAELAATCSTLGRLHKGEYLIEPECIESVKDLIRYLKRDNEAHEIRRYLGESKVLQNDLIHIAKSSAQDMPELFDVTLRLLINLTTPTMIFYREEMPAEKIGRNIYLSLIDYNQDYKIAFCDVEFWNKICGKLTNFFEVDWTERSADDGIQIERMLMLLRNILHIPADVENEKRPENDITIHDKILWALRQSQILELLLFVAASENEEQYYLNLLEIFSLILREQNPKWLACCDTRESTEEKNKDTFELAKVREAEKRNQNKYLNMRNFNATYVIKGVKSLSNNDVICHKSLDKVNDLNVNQNKKQIKARRNKIPIESERRERRSTFTVRLFLKEFCLEFLNNGFGNFMSAVKNRLDSGKSLAHDETYYFWALKFFLDFTVASNLDVALIKHCLSMESFHFVQTSMDNAFEHLLSEKKKIVNWVKRIHLILKAYHSLLETLLWMDCSKSPLIRSVSREIKSELFYVVEYREMTLHVLLRYDSTKFSVSYLRDLIQTTHLFIKLLEEYSKQTKLVVQKVTRKKPSKKKSKNKEKEVETKEQKWEKIKDDVYDILSSENLFPEIPPFDAALDIPIDDQKGTAMKNIQKLLLKGEIREGIGLLRSSRQVWPENDYFGSEGMLVEDECMALQEICMADLGVVEEEKPQENNDIEVEKENEEEEVETKEQKWEKIKDDVYDILSSENLFPEIPPFDAALDIPVEDQKERAMKNIQKLLLKGEIREGIGLLRSSRQVWPENDYFGSEGMSVEDECMALQEICMADLGVVEEEKSQENDDGVENENEDDEEEEEEQTHVVEQDFDIMDYKKRLVNKKIVEGCSVLLKNYKSNSDHTNHCVIKLLHRIGWECCMPAMLYQASLFWTLLQIMNDKTRNYNEINTFTINLMRKFRKDAAKSPVIFLELLFWKEHNVALEIQHGYQPYEDKQKSEKRTKKKKKKGENAGLILSEDEELPKKRTKKKKGENESQISSEDKQPPKKRTKKKKGENVSQTLSEDKELPKKRTKKKKKKGENESQIFSDDEELPKERTEKKKKKDENVSQISSDDEEVPKERTEKKKGENVSQIFSEDDELPKEHTEEKVLQISSEDEELPKERTKKKKKKGGNVSQIFSDDEELSNEHIKEKVRQILSDDEELPNEHTKKRVRKIFSDDEELPSEHTKKKVHQISEDEELPSEHTKKKVRQVFSDDEELSNEHTKEKTRQILSDDEELPSEHIKEKVPQISDDEELPNEHTKKRVHQISDDEELPSEHTKEKVPQISDDEELPNEHTKEEVRQIFSEDEELPNEQTKKRVRQILSDDEELPNEHTKKRVHQISDDEELPSEHTKKKVRQIFSDDED